MRQKRSLADKIRVAMLKPRGNRRRQSRHGASKTPEFRIWVGMINRCHRPGYDVYLYYGAIGVKVCPRWRDSFEAFLADVGPRPSKEHSLDRYPNPAGDYEPGNVRWATSQEQAANRRPKLSPHLRESLKDRIARVRIEIENRGEEPPIVPPSHPLG